MTLEGFFDQSHALNDELTSFITIRTLRDQATQALDFWVFERDDHFQSKSHPINSTRMPVKNKTGWGQPSRS